jgi:hypothetical protein
VGDQPLDLSWTARTAKVFLAIFFLNLFSSSFNFPVTSSFRPSSYPVFQRASLGTAAIVLLVSWRLVNVLSFVQAGGARRIGLAGQAVVVGAKIGGLAAPRAAIIDRRRRFD